MNGRRGTVWHAERQVGALREDDNRVLRFAYDGAWLDGGGFPVSIHLPLSLGDEEVDAHAFFAGLLPEGGTRERICRQHGIAFEDDTGLLLDGERHVAGPGSGAQEVQELDGDRSRANANQSDRVMRSGSWCSPMPPRRLLDRVGELATEMPGVAHAAREAFAHAHGDTPAYDRLEEAVRRRCRWTLDSLGGR